MSHIYWNWTDFCPNGLTPYHQKSNDLLPCFQQIVLQLPVYIIFAALSSYHFGSLNRPTIRNALQLRSIYLRIFISVSLSILPAVKLIYYQTNQLQIYPADVLTGCAKCVMWSVHVGYLLALRSQGELNHRGPLILNVFWTAISVLDIIWFRTSLRYENLWPWSLALIICNSIYFLSFIPNGKAVFQRISFIPPEENQSLTNHRYVHFNLDLTNEMSLGHAQDEANFASRMLFYWVEPLITKGLAGNLRKIEDLFDLPDCLNIQRINEKLKCALNLFNSSLIKAMHKTYGREFYAIGILRFLSDTAGFAGPLLLGALLNEHTSENSGTDIMPYYYAMGLFFSAIISAFCGTHFNWRISIVTMKMRTGIVSAIYRKSLEAQGLQDAKPEILNLMSTDTDRIVNSCISFHSFWSIPFQLFTTLYLLYTQIGSAFIAGVCFASALIPINRLLATKIQKYSEGLMAAKDKRIAITAETINGAKQIKLHALEDFFIEKIRDCRKIEIEFLSKRKYLDALCVYFWATTPVVMCLLTFGVSVLMGNTLVASTTFTSVALLNMLIGPLNAFPWVLNGLIEAWVSVKRVQELLDLENLDFGEYYGTIGNERFLGSQELDLQIKNASFTYKLHENQEPDFVFELEGINLEVKKNELVCIEGAVGSGKTTLMSGIIASINCTKGMVCVNNTSSGFGYVSQQPWLQRGTIKENIIWGALFDEQRYKNVLHACCLVQDLQTLGGDRMGIGENGRTLSGGQKMRVALARAVYQDKQIYLFDDILSCVDAHVANHIIKYCILGLLKEKTRIIITEHRSLFFHANQILYVENNALHKSKFMSESFELSDNCMNIDDSELNESVKSSIDLIHNNSVCSKSISQDDDNRSSDSVMLEETKEYGYINKNVLKIYFEAMTLPITFNVLLFVILMQVSRNVCDGWLAYWVNEVNPTNGTNSTILASNILMIERNQNGEISSNAMGYYLGIFAALGILNSIITLIRAFIFAFAGIKAAKYIHDKMLNCVLFTKFYFFDVTSVGRILNRFSSDTFTVDDSLPFISNILLAQTFGLLGALVITVYAMPWLTLFVIPMIPIYLSLQYRYRHASRDIKRLSSNALSPLYTHFTETLQGLTTIRAMRSIPRFLRDFNVKVEESIKAQLTACAAQQWLALRLQFLGCFLVGGAGLLSAITFSHATNPSLVGLAISYALSITSLLGGVLNAFAETEQEMIAVERISQYMQLEKEENADGSADPPFGWPLQGSVIFKDVFMKYREHLNPALIDFNIKTEAYERIAIVGRTGAGKSSILAALLRVAPLQSGGISIDCVDLKTLPLRTLRDRIVIIPQEPFLFEGTIRDNLDPRRKFIESELWNAITNCLATPLVQSLGGLNGYLQPGGSNLSAGQKQLLCLIRALLKNSKVICIDEGTSNLDSDSEAAIQIALRNSFKSSTVFFIAHRLKGLQHMDRIIVMDFGKIIEQGTPSELANNSDSVFAKMLQEQSNKDFHKLD